MRFFPTCLQRQDPIVAIDLQVIDRIERDISSLFDFFRGHVITIANPAARLLREIQNA